MKSQGTALELADKTAKDIVERLRPGCERIEIAGSVRRRKESVGDIEIVLIPKPDVAQFGSTDPEQWPGGFSNQWFRFKTHYNPALIKNGQKYKQISCHSFHPNTIDMFIVTPPAEWGCIYFIRTGPAEWNMKAMKQSHKLGLKFNEGRLLIDETKATISCPEEIDVFNALQWDYVPPEERK